MLTNTFSSSRALSNRKDPTTRPGAKRFIKLMRMIPTSFPLSSYFPTMYVYSSPSNNPSQGIELFCSVCGTDQTSEWRTNKESTKEDPKLACNKCYGKQVPPEHVCQATGCGKGGSVVKQWGKSPRNKSLWFCKSCYKKEVRLRFPQLSLDVPPRTVSLHLASFDFYIFRRSLKSTRRRAGSARSARPFNHYLVHLKRRNLWMGLQHMPL